MIRWRKIASPERTITFSEFVFATDTPITNQYASLGETFTPSLYDNTQPLFFPTDVLANFSFAGDPAHNPVSIVFAQDQTAAAFAMQTNPGMSTFEALLDGVQVERFSAMTTLSALPDESNASNFYGFKDTVFDEIRITSGTTYFQIDNLQLANAVPEPGVLGLLGMGLLGLVAARRRRA